MLGAVVVNHSRRTVFLNELRARERGRPLFVLQIGIIEIPEPRNNLGITNSERTNEQYSFHDLLLAPSSDYSYVFIMAIE